MFQKPHAVRAAKADGATRASGTATRPKAAPSPGNAVRRKTPESAAHRSETPTAPAKSVAKVRATRKRASLPDGPASVQGDERLQMIASAAYYRAERRGFAGGSPEQDWLEAEAEIDLVLRGGV